MRYVSRCAANRWVFNVDLKLTFIALKLQISFCQNSWQNRGERPYVYKRCSFQTRCHECFNKHPWIMHLNWNTILYILSWRRVVVVIVHCVNPALVCLTSATNISRRWTVLDKGNIDRLAMFRDMMWHFWR